MSKAYKPQVFLIRTLTNLHMGGGDSNYDHVDKQVQRDPTSKFPTIFSSGFKGALRDHLVNDATFPSDYIREIFGSKPTDTDSQQGQARFLSADLLAMPCPAEDKAYKLVTTEEVKKAFEEKVHLMGNKQFTLSITAEEINHKDFKTLTDELPIIARNHLENGISQNLWYEEVVPRETLFGCIMLLPEEEKSCEVMINTKVDKKVIQIGANATIGYGLCQITKIA